MGPQHATSGNSTLLLKLLIFVMFAAFAMTTDSVGTVIPEIIREFDLGLTAAGAFQYSVMTGIGLSAIFLGFLADRIGRRASILLGLALFGASSALFAAGHAFGLFVALLFFSGLGIGIFKAGALALIGDISRSTREHAATMNLIEGFFGIGAIVGPAIVAASLQVGASWKTVYLIAAALCAALVLGTVLAPFPPPQGSARSSDKADVRESFRMLRDPAALFFSAALILYVGAEAAIYVWAPTYFGGYAGANAWLVGYVVSAFFVLRAGGRFLGAWLLTRLDWAVVLAVCSTFMALLFIAAVVGGRAVALYTLPATGLFMSVLYPTLNSTGINCFDRARHGSIAGLLLFFTCVGAVAAPLAMGLAGDLSGDTRYSMVVGAAFAVLLAFMCLWNLGRRPMDARLRERNLRDYAVGAPAVGSVQAPA